MKKYLINLLLVLNLLGFAHSAHSTEDVILGDEKRMALAEPREICISRIQTIGDLDNMTLLHNLVIPLEEHGKRGVVFVGAHLKSQPEVTWLTGGNNQWIDSRGNEEFSYPIAYRAAGELDPVIPITVFGKPVNLASYADEGEVWVGYGLWPENGPDNAAELLAAGKLGEVSAWRHRAAYEEMQSSGRFQKIWAAGEMHGFYPDICLTATEIIEREPMGVGTASQDKNTPAND